MLGTEQIQLILQNEMEISVKKKIFMIATGGTIASVQSKNGLTPGITSDEIISYIPMVSEYCEIDTIQLFNIDSTNVYHKHWVEIAKCIQKHYDKYDGFVVTHGTDTMAYTAAALSYMIQQSPKPIAITGSQISIAAENTDARDNLLNAFIYASDDKACGVHLIFDNKVILGTRARKSRTKSYNAFASIDYPEIAIFKDHHLYYYIEEKQSMGPIYSFELNARIFVLKMIPGVSSDIFGYLKEHYDAIIMEGFGVGGVPKYEDEHFEEAIHDWVDSGKILVITTQVAHEGSDMEVYAVGQKIKLKYSLIEAFDMTTEAIVTKLMWILGKTKNPQEVRELFYEPVAKDILV